jgi:hypothetical protein
VLVVVRWLIVVVRVVVAPDSVITNLAENVDVPPRFACHVVGQVRTEAKRVFHRC